MESPDPHASAAVAANQVVIAAAEAAKAVTMTMDERTTQSLISALREVFGEGIHSQRFVDVSRIPLICSNINSMHENIKEVKDMMIGARNIYVNQDQFWPVRVIAFGLVSLIVVAVVGALLALVIVKR